jgi:hypothetical protein
VGPNADPLVLLWERPTLPPPDPDDAIYPSIESFWQTWERPNRFRILHDRASGLEILDLPETVQTYHHVQPLPGGEYLLVAGYPRDERPNADVYSASGELLRSWHAGQFVTHLQTTSDGAIWAGYSDIGVVEEDPLASNGATCFDAYGHVLVSYADLAATQNVETILHCYAMNVISNSEVWIWYCDWSGNRFPLVQLIDGQIHGYWPAGKHHPLRVAPKAFAVAGDRVLMHEGNRDRDRFYLNSRFRTRVTEVLIGDDEKSRSGGIRGNGRQPRLERIHRIWGAPAPNGIEVIGRGSRLFLWKHRTLFVVDAASFPPS